MTCYLKYEEPLAIYDNYNDGDEFIVGFLAKADDKFALFNTITTRGYEDGFYLTLVDRIYRIDRNDRYISKILVFWHNLKQQKTNIPVEGKDALDSLLCYSLNEEKIISIFLFDEESTEITGFIDEYNRDTITIDLIDDYETRCGTSTIEVSIITKIRCDSGFERNLTLLLKSMITD